jgi:hypothetical protein
MLGEVSDHGGSPEGRIYGRLGPFRGNAELARNESPISHAETSARAISAQARSRLNAGEKRHAGHTTQ